MPQRHTRAAPCADNHRQAHGNRIGEIHEAEIDKKRRAGHVAREVQRTRIRGRAEKVKTERKERKQQKRARAGAEEAIIKAHAKSDKHGQDEHAPREAMVG